MNKIYTDYIFCIPGETFSQKFLNCWSETLIYLLKESIDFIYINHYTSIVATTRNDMIRNFPGKEDEKNILPFGNKINAKKIIFIDDDIIWTVEDLKKIIKSEKDIVSGFYKMNETNEFNEYKLAAFKNEKIVLDYEIENENNLIELTECGLGFVAINFEIFQNLKFPWFEVLDFFDPNFNKVINVSEDVNFFRKARNLGYKVYGDPTIKLGHEKLKVLKF